jgi:hypothetical protein
LTRTQVEVAYKNIKEVRTAPRAFGLWGDCVIFLKVRASTGGRAGVVQGQYMCQYMGGTCASTGGRARTARCLDGCVSCHHMTVV